MVSAAASIGPTETLWRLSSSSGTTLLELLLLLTNDDKRSSNFISNIYAVGREGGRVREKEDKREGGKE